MQSSEGVVVRIGSKRDLIDKLEQAIERIGDLQDQSARIRRENARLGTLLEGFPAMEIANVDQQLRIDELLLLLKDAEKRSEGLENTVKVKERVIVELKELRLDTSGRDRKIEHLERQLVNAEARNMRAQEYIDGQPARSSELANLKRECEELEKRCEHLDTTVGDMVQEWYRNGVRDAQAAFQAALEAELRTVGLERVFDGLDDG